ncbi:MAG: hypothetical protein RI955_38 [Bacteroidota bacterium]
MNNLLFQPKRMTYAPLSFNHIFNEVFNENLFNGADFSHHSPMVNIKESDNGFQIELAAPGFLKENFSITINNQVLSIAAEKQAEQKSESEKYTRKEFSYNKFSRNFNLSENVDSDNIKAAYDNGILKVNVFKKAKAEPEIKKVDIE